VLLKEAIKSAKNSEIVQNPLHASSAYFIRDSNLKGFALRVFPSGTIKYIAEVWFKGKSHRKTLGSYPTLSLTDARQKALSFIQGVHSGHNNEKAESIQITLECLFNGYVEGDRLKPSTEKNHRQVIFFYLSDWLRQSVASITKEMIERRFYKIRDMGIDGGKPTYSQATKTMRILSALMNFAMADELIQSNPVDVLKQKRIDRSIRKRDHYLPASKVRELLDKTPEDDHPVTLAIWLMLYVGLRKNEALRLKWSGLRHVEDVQCLVVEDTKNHRPHYVPVTDNLTCQNIFARFSLNNRP